MAAKKDKPTPLLDSNLHDDLDGLGKAVKKLVVVEDDLSIEIPEDKMERAVDVLALLRRLPKDIDENRKTLTKELDAQLKPYMSESLAMRKLAAELEGNVVAGLMSLLKAKKLPTEVQTKAGVELTVVGKPAPVLDDLKKVPKEFMLPPEQCIDWAAIRNAFSEARKADKNVDLSTLIKGIGVTEDFILRTSLPTVVE